MSKKTGVETQLIKAGTGEEEEEWKHTDRHLHFPNLATDDLDKETRHLA